MAWHGMAWNKDMQLLEQPTARTGKPSLNTDNKTTNDFYHEHRPKKHLSPNRNQPTTQQRDNISPEKDTFGGWILYNTAARLSRTTILDYPAQHRPTTMGETDR